MRLNNRIHKRKSETMSGRLFPFYEAFESAAADIGRKSRTIVFDHQLGRALVRTQPNADSASLRQVGQFVFKQIADHTIQQRQIGIQ